MVSNELVEVIGALLGTGMIGSGTVAVKAKKDTIKLHERIARLEEFKKSSLNVLTRIEDKLDRLIEKENR